MLSLVQKEFYYPTFGDDKLFTENSVTAVTSYEIVSLSNDCRKEITGDF